MDTNENGMQVIMHIGRKLPIYTALVDTYLKANGMDCVSATAEQIDPSEKRSVKPQMAMGFILGSYRVCFVKIS